MLGSLFATGVDACVESACACIGMAYAQSCSTGGQARR
jgi:hypothetical protein